MSKITRIKRFEVYCEKDSKGKDHYYANLFYVRNGITNDIEYEIPKIDLRICEDSIVRIESTRIVHRHSNDGDLEYGLGKSYVDINGKTFEIEEVSNYTTVDEFGNDIIFTEPIQYVKRIVNEKPVEVTMEDIEKKFGCKVKIVKENDND